MFILRNVGNIVPEPSLVNEASTVDGMLDLGVVMLNIQNLIVCGHSDCKAMGLLHTMVEGPWDEEALRTSPLKAWMHK